MEARKLTTEEFTLLQEAETFSSFSVRDISQAKTFYGEKLGLDVEGDDMGTLNLSLRGDKVIFIYPKKDHTPATFTVLNFEVEDVEDAVEQLTERGIVFEKYGGEIQTDEKGIHSSNGHTMAWFKDPAGNILSVCEK